MSHANSFSGQGAPVQQTGHTLGSHEYNNNSNIQIEAYQFSLNKKSRNSKSKGKTDTKEDDRNQVKAPAGPVPGKISKSVLSKIKE